jgi:hypothetical protein
LRLQRPHLPCVDGSRPALAEDASGLRFRDPLKLPLSAQVRLKLRKHPSMSRKHFPAAVLVSMGFSAALKRSPAGSHGPHDVLKVADACVPADQSG